jgi:hypothetical protein
MAQRRMGELAPEAGRAAGNQPDLRCIVLVRHVHYSNGAVDRRLKLSRR